MGTAEQATGTGEGTGPSVRTTRFGHLSISYDERVLRPRSWTVQQSRWAADVLGSAPPGPVLELCAGVGQIGLLAIAERPRPLVAVEVSDVACDHARRNAAAAGLAPLVEVRNAALESALRPEEHFALVIADPPWVPSDDTDDHPDDPVHAVDGGDDGLDVARACVRLAARHLLAGGALLLQLGTRAQVERLAGECASALDLAEVRDGERGVLALLTTRRGSQPLDGDDVVDGDGAGTPRLAGEPLEGVD